MAIREKARALFRPRSSKSNGDTLSKTSTQTSERERWPSNVYKPGEPMPRPKYRAVPRKEHKDKLEAFSFAEAWRKNSFQSQYSPMGTRAPSRRNSREQASRRSSWYSMDRKSFGGKSDSRADSITGASDRDNGGLKPPREHHMGAAKPPKLQNQPEQEGDDDVANVGISRLQSFERGTLPPSSRPADARSNAHPLNSLSRTVTAHDHEPFSEQDIALAMKRSHLAVPAH